MHQLGINYTLGNSLITPVNKSRHTATGGHSLRAQGTYRAARRSPGCWRWRDFAVAGPVALRAGESGSPYGERPSASLALRASWERLEK